LDGIIFATWVTRIPAIQERLGLKNSVLGLALLMISIGALLTMPVVGRMVARLGSGRMTLWAVGSFAVFLILPALMPSVFPLCLSLFLFGVGFGGMNIAANAQAVSVERAYGRPIMASFHAVFSLGGIVGGFLGSLAAAWRVPPTGHFLAVSIFALTGTLLIRRLLMADPVVVAVDTPAGGKTARSFRLMALGAIAFCSMFGEGAMADWSAVFLRQVSLSPPATAALGFAAFSICMTIGRLIADRLTIVIGPVRIVRFGGLLAASGVMLAMLFPQPITAIAGFALVGAGLSSLVPTLFSAAGKSPGVAPSVGIATVATIGYFGFLSGPPLIGVVSDLVSLRWAIGFVSVAGAVAMLLAGHAAAERGGEPEVQPVDAAQSLAQSIL
jgi:MFS family permease